jgi:hypothetical protein
MEFLIKLKGQTGKGISLCSSKEVIIVKSPQSLPDGTVVL